jgi:hypothetical protein
MFGRTEPVALGVNAAESVTREGPHPEIRGGGKDRGLSKILIQIWMEEMELNSSIFLSINKKYDWN